MSAEAVVEEVAAGGGEEEGDAEGVDDGHGDEGGGVAHMLGDDAAQEYAEAQAEVPAGEDGAVGCAALVVVGKVYNHVLHRGPHVAVAEAYEQC